MAPQDPPSVPWRPGQRSERIGCSMRHRIGEIGTTRCLVRAAGHNGEVWWLEDVDAESGGWFGTLSMFGKMFWEDDEKWSCCCFLQQPYRFYSWTCKHARLAHLDQTFRNQVAQELLVIIWTWVIKIACGTTLSVGSTNSFSWIRVVDMFCPIFETYAHTLDKNWSFIGSVGNWIPCKQN